MRRFPVSKLLLLTVTVLWILSAVYRAEAGNLTSAMPQVQGTRRIVLEQLEALLGADPQLQIIGQGSWLRPGTAAASKIGGVSREYADPLLGGTSDHDLRLVAHMEEGKNGLTPNQVRQLADRWKGVQSELRKGIAKVFEGADPKAAEQILMRYGFTAEQAAAISKQGTGKIVENILKSVNVYSPPQLIRGIVDDKTAAATFEYLGSKPNLAGKVVEGVWGEGAEAAIQEFEQGGKLFYRSANGTLRAGFVDLAHYVEGYGRYSLGGAANMAAQWAEKAAEAAGTGDLKLVAKYLKRLKGTLNLALKKANLGTDALQETLGNLDFFIAKAEAGEQVVLEGGLDLRAFLRKARMRSGLLGQMARNTGSVDRQIMMAILENNPGSRWAKAGEWFQEVWERADNFVIFERVLQGAFLVFSVWQVSGTWGEKGMEQALRQAGVEAAMLASLPVGLIAALANYMLEGAKEAGYDMAVKPQEWSEFLAGISSVKGYEGETSLNRSIEELALKQASVEGVRRTVELQADQISKLKETGAPDSEATASSREAIKEKLIAKMTPIVLAEWLNARKRILTEYLDMALELDYRMNNIIIRTSSNPQFVTLEENGPASAEIRLETDKDIREIQDLLGRMEAKIKPLGGKDKLVQFGYRGSVTWDQDGQKKEVTALANLRDLFQPQPFQFPGRGSHSLSAEFKLEVYVLIGGGLGEAMDVFDAKPLLERVYGRKIPISVEVATIARTKVEPVKEAKLNAPAEATVGDVLKLSWDRSQVPNFKTGKYRVMLSPPGTKFNLQDLMLATYDFTGTGMGDHFKYTLEILSEKAEGDRIDIEVQIPQVTEIKQAEQFDLAILFLDKEASLDAQLNKAMKDLDKANEEMEKKLAAMTEEERQAFIKKIEEETEKAQGQPPPAPPADADAEALPPGTVVSYPIFVRPPGIQLKAPAGWSDRPDERLFWRSVVKQAGSPNPGNHVFVDAVFDVILSDAGRDGTYGGMIESSFKSGSQYRAAPRRVTISGFAGELSQERPTREDFPEVRRHNLSGEAVLKKGKVYMQVNYHATVAGYRRVTKDEQGREQVEYDTKEQADSEADQIARDINELLGAPKVGAPPGAGAAPVAEDKVSTGEAYVRLVPAKTSCEPGEFIEIQAVVEKARPADGPFRYEWSGNHEGKGEKVTFFASEPGTYSISVIVYGSKGLVGSTSVEITVQ